MTPKSVAQKLRIEPNSTLWSSHPQRVELLEPLPRGVRVVREIPEATTALVFAEDGGSLADIVAIHADGLREAQSLWVAYPKGNRSDINRDTLWPILAEHGMRPIGQVALDDVWSAMRFRALRPGEVFKGGSA